jgi:hypothetical protein
MHLRQISVAIPVEIVTWLIWFALADNVNQPFAAAVLLMLMHVKH